MAEMAEVEIPIDEARRIVGAALCSVGYSSVESDIITRQIIDSELRGVPSAGLARAISIIERTVTGPSPRGMRITRDTPVSVLIDGGGVCGYLVAHEATRLGIQKALNAGVAVVGANDTWYTGMLAHYMEMATDAGLVCFAVSSSAPRVAPHGATEGRFGTNPIAFGIPSSTDPVIFDAGTSELVMSQLALARRLGVPLPEGAAYDGDGVPTTDADSVLDGGSLRVWGGHRGSGLALVVQTLGILVGGMPFPRDNEGMGFLFIAIRPDLFGEAQQFLHEVSAYADAVRSARTEPGADPVRVPFERSASSRRASLRRGTLRVDRRIVDELRSQGRSR
jgi:delta1-piperideine-2-carboxylate reductase